MNFCKRFSLYFLILVVSLISTSCKGTPNKAYFKRDSAYDTFANNTTQDEKPRRVGNVVYLGTESQTSIKTKDPTGPSFNFEDLRR